MCRQFAYAFALLLVGACASNTALKRGSEFLAEGRYAEAEAAYAQALEESPTDPQALEGLHASRRGRVETQLEKVQGLIGRDALAKALAEALKARRMPLDLEDVDLTRRIDALVADAAQRAERQVSSWEEGGQYLAAAVLAQDIAHASGAAERRAWAKEVTQRAVEHYEGLAKTLRAQGLPGGAAVSMAVAGHLAKALGLSFEPAVVAAAWVDFSKEVCFGEPAVTLGKPDLSQNHPDVVERLRGETTKTLTTWSHFCGEGERPLNVVISLEQAEVVDDTKTETHAQALPGHDIETTEEYFEERSYVETETYIHQETRIEKVERRDCAPRPGQPPGCREWTEEKTVEVPVEKTRDVKRIKRIRKTRPKQGPFPKDKVLTYEVTSTVHAVTLAGTVAVEGTDTTRRFALEVRSADSGNAEARGPRMLIKADPLNVRSMDDVVAEAAQSLAKEVLGAAKSAAAVWSQADDELARRRAREGQLPQAEEAYLRLLALGVGQGAHVDGFFERRYGKPAAEVFGLLMAALGREAPRGRDTAVLRGRQQAFPTAKVPAKTPPVPHRESAPPEDPATEQGSAPQPLDPSGAGDKSAPDEKPSRGPIVPR